MPIVQGYVQSAKFDGDNFFTGMNDEMAEIAKFDLLLISRRSVFRAGSYLRRNLIMLVYDTLTLSRKFERVMTVGDVIVSFNRNTL